MKTLSKIGLVLFLAAGIFSFQSCSEVDDSVKDNVEVKTTTGDYINLLSSFNSSTVEEATSENVISGDASELKSTEVSTLGCMTIIREPNDNGSFWPRNWTIDFGDENCECVCGMMRRGKIHVSLSGWWRNDSSLREITFEDYYFDDNKLEGVKTILNTGLNDAGNMTFTRKVKGGKIVYADGTSMTWDCEKQSELIEGGATFVFADDVWSVTGGGSGVNIDGKNFKMTITSPLIYKKGCFHPVSGVVTIETDGEETQTIDYGNGECDNLATVTVGDETEEIEL
jgi:hypothetical protein